jgi:pyruvate/2-oxoglutarate dehydrogenase complex dihydrolipoamide dehydrogenase (E3) component
MNDPTPPTSTADSTPSTPPPPDAVIIGAGSGGLTVAVGLSSFGKRVRLIERADVGGDCTNSGCIPSKALLHASAEPAGRSGTEILAHVRSRRDHLRDEETDYFGSMDGIDLQFGAARLIGPGTVEVTAADGSVDVVEAKHVVIATGSRARRLPIEGLPDERYLTNAELFEENEPPSKLVIVGGGPIGVEMATAFRRLGVEVVVLEAEPRVLPTMLPEASAIVERSLVSAGVDVRAGLVAKSFDEATRTLHIGPLDGGASDRIPDVDRVLMAVGRVPNSDGLGLEALGIETDRGHIVIDGKGRSSHERVWSVGDVSTEGGTTHLANAWGRRVIKAIIAPPAPAGKKPVHPAVAFCAPEAAMIGDQPVEVPSHVRRIVYDLSKADRAFTDGVDDGVIIVDVRRFSGTIVGATVVGPRAGELISTFSLAMTAGIKLQKWYPVVWPYPAYSDALGAVVDDFMVRQLTNLHRDFPRWLWGRIRRKS